MNILDTKVIELELDASYKVKHEKYEKFPESYFSDVYNQAARIIKEIIDAGKADFDEESLNGYTEPVSNLIAFNGKRGSGKTSAMLSFCDFLKEFEKYQNNIKVNACRELIDLKQRISFTVLDCIDATLVSGPKDLIGAILGKMLVAIKKKEDRDSQSGNPKNIEIRKLKSRLGAIYSSLVTSDVDKESTAPGEVLEQLSRSWNQQQAFREAVNKFNDYMVEYKDNTHNYLVVPIDDVDMNFENGYQLLEAVRKYLMASNVIVLLAADYLQLCRLCMKNYKELLSGKKEHREELAHEYLEKMIPTGRRIYMPELYQEESLYGKKILIKNEKEKSYSIKKVILCQVWEHVGIVLNKNAGVRHWLMPNSLRKLSNYINSMRALEDFGKDSDKEKIFSKNISWYTDDIISRYLNEKNIETQSYRETTLIIKKFNEEISENKIPYLVNRLKSLEYALQGENYTIVEASYGVVLGQLYRLWDTENHSVMAHAISFVLSLYLRKYIFSIDNSIAEEKSEKKKDFLKVTNGEFWGNLDMVLQGYSGRAVLKKYFKTCEVEELDKDNELTEKQLLVLSILTGLIPDTNTGKITGTHRFGNFVDIIFDYENRIPQITDFLKNQKCYVEKAKNIQTASDSLLEELREWEHKFGTTCVLPFDSIEFMLNLFEELYGTQKILKRLTLDNSYSSTYKMALDKIESILNDYDEFYAEVRNKCNMSVNGSVPIEFQRKYAEVYRECPFIKYMQENPDERDKIIKKYVSFFNNPEIPDLNPPRRVRRDVGRNKVAFVDIEE